MLDGMSHSIQRSRIENLHSREVGRQSPTGLIFIFTADYGKTFRGRSRRHIVSPRAQLVFYSDWHALCADVLLASQ